MIEGGSRTVLQLLEAVASGAIPVEKALRELSIMEVAKVQDYARLDLDRVRRWGRTMTWSGSMMKRPGYWKSPLPATPFQGPRVHWALWVSSQPGRLMCR